VKHISGAQVAGYDWMERQDSLKTDFQPGGEDRLAARLNPYTGAWLETATRFDRMALKQCSSQRKQRVETRRSLRYAQNPPISAHRFKVYAFFANSC